MTGAVVRGVAALKRALSTHDPAALDEAVTLLRAAGGDPSVLANLGAALRTRYRWAPHAGDLDAAVDVLGRAVAATPSGDAAAAGRLGNWGLALGDRYEAAGVEDDLHASVDALERAVAAAGGDAEQAARQGGNLAGALLERHRATRDPTDLDRAIDLARSAARTGATTADRDSARGNLAAALHDRFRRDGALDDLEDAISAALPDADGRLGPRGLGILGVLLHARFQLTGDADDLGQAITVLTRAEEVARPGPDATVGGDRAQVLGALGSALLSRFLWRGEPADLDAAITWQRAAAAAASAVDRAMRLSNLGTALASRPGREPRAADELREALERHDEAVALGGPAHPDRAAILANRAGALLAAAEVLGLDTTAVAVEGYREAAELAASHPQARAGYLADEAVAVRVRAVNTGDAAAAREAVRLLRDALALGGPEHRDHPVFCSWLGSALVGRYVRHGAVGDLEEALYWHERAVAGLRPGRVGAARWFAARAYARRLHAQLTGRVEDVSAAVTAFDAALQAEPDARRLPDVLAGLGSALDLRGDTVADLDAAIEARTEAVRLAAGHDRYRGMWLSDLANSLRRRGELLGDAGSADLAESHRLHREAVEVTPSDHPEYATVLSNLAGSHRDRYVRTGAQADLDAALDLLRRAAATVTAPALPRFVAAETGGQVAADTGGGPTPRPPSPPRSTWCPPRYGVAATALGASGLSVTRAGSRRRRSRPRWSMTTLQVRSIFWSAAAPSCGTSGPRPVPTSPRSAMSHPSWSTGSTRPGPSSTASPSRTGRPTPASLRPRPGTRRGRSCGGGPSSRVSSRRPRGRRPPRARSPSSSSAATGGTRCWSATACGRCC